MKTDVLALVDTLSLGQADQTLASSYYDELVDRLGLQMDLLVDVTMVEHAAGNPQITWPTEAVAILAVFFDGRRLSRLSRMDVMMLPAGWRAKKGSPIGFVIDGEPDRTLRLYPTPDAPSDVAGFIHGEPLGVDYPNQQTTIIHTVRRDDLPDLFTLPLACEVLAWEFARDSDHRDPQAVAAFHGLAEFLFALVPGYVAAA